MCSEAQTHTRIHGHADAKSSKIRMPTSLALKPFTMSLFETRARKGQAVLVAVLLSNSKSEKETARLNTIHVNTHTHGKEKRQTRQTHL